MSQPPKGLVHPDQQTNQPTVSNPPPPGFVYNPTQQPTKFSQNSVLSPMDPVKGLVHPDQQTDQPTLDPNADAYYNPSGPGQAAVWTENNPNWTSGNEQGGDSGWQMFDPSKYGYGRDYINKMRQEAMAAPGQSPWLQYQMQQDKIRQGADLDALQNQGASGLATAQGNMAMRGGLTSGATERMGQQNLMGQLMGRQNLSRSSAAREAGYRQQASERQRQMLGQLGAEERAYGQYHSGLDQYQQQQANKLKGLEMMADATGRSGRGGGGGGLLSDLLGTIL